jgi:hypothetical protein
MTVEVNIELTKILENIFKSEKYSECFYPYLHSEELNEQKILPVVMIKMISKFLDHFISNGTYHIIIKTIRKNNNIESKFNLSKYQLTRIFLEVIFAKEKTADLDYLFEQLKIYGNYVLDVSSSYQEIIDYVYQSNEKTNQHIRGLIEELNKKLEKNKDDYSKYKSSVFLDSIKNLETKIANHESRIVSREKEVIEKEIYDYCLSLCKRISMKNQEILKNKVLDYLSTLQSDNENDISQMKKIDDFEKVNQDNVFGKRFENIIHARIKPLLKEHGFEVLFNIEFEFDFSYSGIKLEYDFIIGKIINNNFVIYGVFDAKICKGLVRNDIHKLVKGIEYLSNNKLKLRSVFKKQYQHMFNDIISIEDDKILTGYFCQSYYNHKKELSKTISSYMVNNGYSLFALIRGDTITMEPFRYELEETINQDYNELNGIFEKNNIIIYSIDNIHKLDLECEMKDELKDELKSYMPSEKKNRLE